MLASKATASSMGFDSFRCQFLDWPEVAAECPLSIISLNCSHDHVNTSRRAIENLRRGQYRGSGITVHLNFPAVVVCDLCH